MADLKNLKRLLPDTRALLLELIGSCEFLHKYVLSGGSALALYLGHRKSEDLDFLEPIEKLNKSEIRDFFQSELKQANDFQQNGGKIINHF